MPTRITSTLLATLALALLVGPGPEAHAATSRTNIETRPSGADTYLVTPTGEKHIGITPIHHYRLPRGKVTLRMDKEGYETLTETVQIKARIDTFFFNLVRKVEPAELSFMSAPEFEGATVTIDGEPEGEVPTTVELPPGRHQAVVTKEGFGRWERWIEVSEGQKVSFEVVLKAPKKETGSILVTSVPSAAELRLNGAPRGKTPTVVEVTAGEYTLEVAAEGYAPWEKTVSVPPGERVTVEAKLASPTGSTGSLEIVADVEGAEIRVDGEVVGAAPVTAEDLSAGAHRVEARAEGYATATAEAKVKPGQTSRLELSLRDATRRATGTLRVVANVSDATARVDGGEPQEVPLVLDDVAAGTHFVTVDAEGYGEWTRSVKVQPGGVTEVAAELQRAGRLEVTVKKDEPQAEVFLDGEPIGSTPLKAEIPAGTHTVTLKRPDGKTEEHAVAIGPESPTIIEAKFGEKKRRIRHRAMPFSAQPIDRGYGAFSMNAGFPYAVGARVSGGIKHDIDLGLTWRSALDTVNEFEGRVKYMIARSRAFAFGAESGLGFGVGADDRNAFNWRLRILGSILISERAAITARIGTNFFTDKTGPGNLPEHEDRDNGVQFLTSLVVEFRVSKHWNGFILVEGEPFTDGRELLEEGIFGDAKNAGVRAAAGVSLLF
ncbi:MAG: PEGA domain-containing protein [Myxococcota bacterium]